ncbi:MAG TPA: glycosyltransferase family 4 protein [Bacteroidia bacterium]|nr:glycosyltransferase family 4 protein [Bacteroidia bacterium]
MRIALLTDGIWPYRIGGMQKHSYYLVKYFAQQGVHVDLYHMNDGKFDINKLEFFTEEEKKFITPFVFTFPNKGRWPWHYLQESYLHSKKMYQCFVKQPRVDFIYSKGYTGWYFIKQKQGGVKLPPIGLRLHGYEIFQQGSGAINLYRKYLYLPLMKYLNNKADYVYSYGGGITNIIKTNLPQTASKIIEVPAAIESAWVYENNNTINKPIRFAFLGRYEIRKGVKELSTALKNLIGKCDFRFDFIGPIPDEFKINSPQIKYHGSVSDAKKIKSILRKMDVFVLPSHAEGMPNVILEAMASGCAILATDVGAVNVMVDETNGWLIPPLNSTVIQQKMIEIIESDLKSIDAKKTNSVKKIKENFMWDKVILTELKNIKKTI